MVREDRSFIETKRLILRRFQRDDREDVFKIFSNEELLRFVPLFPLKTVGEAEEYLERKLLCRDNPYCWAICLKQDNRAVGYIHADVKSQSRDMGWGLLPELWNHGITSEAGVAVVERLREDGIEYVTATHDVNNLASGGVMRRIGMRYCYSYEEMWQPKNFLVVFRFYQLNLDGDDKRVYRGYWEEHPNHFIEQI